MIVKCPVCGSEVSIPDDALPGELIEHECGVTLEVIIDGGSARLKPLEGVREDWGE